MAAYLVLAVVIAIGCGGDDAAPLGETFARSFATKGVDGATRIATHDGIVISSFTSSGAIDLGGGRRTGDAFVAKYDAFGRHVWSIGLPVDVADIAIDPAGAVYVVGGFAGTRDLGGEPLTAMGTANMYLLKLDGATGDHLWSRRYGNDGNVGGQRLAVFPDGDVVACGGFSRSTSFGGATILHDAAFTAHDVFAVRVAGSDGAHVWSTGFGGTATDTCNGIVATTDQRTVVLGTFYDDFVFAGESNPAFGDLDLYAAGLGPDGQPLWHRRFGSVDSDTLDNATLAPQGDILALGSYRASFSLGGSPLVHIGNQEAFVARISPVDGSVAWAKSVSGPDTEAATGVSLIGDDVVVAGLFDGTALVADIAIPPPPGINVFLIRFRYPDGVASPRVIRGASNVNRVVSATLGDTVVLAGGFQDKADFGVGEVLYNSGDSDAYLVRLPPEP